MKRTASGILPAELQAWFQDMSLLYDRRFDCAPSGDSFYTPKLTYSGPHKYAFDDVRLRAHSIEAAQ